MASASYSFFDPVLQRLRNYQWYWNSSIDPWSSIDERWEKYSDIENEIIEDPNIQENFIIEIDGDYIINLECLLQYKKDDQSTACRIKRIQFDKNQRNMRLREERFVLPVELATSTFLFQQSQNHNELDWLHTHGNITGFYWSRELEGTNKTIADVVKEAAHGIINEGSIIGKTHEAQWLAQQLLIVEHFGCHIKTDSVEYFPSEIGKVCVYLYTKESFWYKLINHVLRNLHSTSIEQVKNLEPFCWLLDWYLYNYPDTNICTVYRGLNLDDRQRQQFMEELMKFTSFTSTSCNRKVAEFYDANTLLIIDINSFDKNHKCIVCGKDISSLSDFPEEEEFLIWPGREFSFVKYEYDILNSKHMIYLKLSHLD